MKVLRDAIIMIVFFGGIWALFTYLPIFNSETELISHEQEADLGDILTDLVLTEYDLTQFEGGPADSALRMVSSRLLDSLGLSEFDYKFYLVQNEQVNAFALPGASIVVFSGLMKFAESPEELASVLAHEIGHVEKRHVLDRLATEFGITLLFSILSGGDAAIISELAQSLISSGFSRKQESAADEFSLSLLERSGISPQALGSFFRRLKREQGDGDSNLELILSHPNLNSRIKASFKYEVSVGFEAKPFLLDWDSVKEEL